MANVRTFTRSFGGGELSPEMLGRIDDVKYQTGLAQCRNFIIRPHGPAVNRPGTRFVREVKDSTKKVRLIPFIYNSTQAMVVEFGDGYCRFHAEAGTLLDGDVPYEIESPYSEDDLPDIHYVQSHDVLTLTHPDHRVYELRRLGTTSWTLTVVDFSAQIIPPSSVAATATTTDAKYTYDYVVTAISKDGISESGPSTRASCYGNVLETGGYNTISWSAVTGASRYRVYKRLGGVYGYIGNTTERSIVDDNIAPDMSITPPIYDESFSSSSILSVPVTNGGSGYGDTPATDVIGQILVSSHGGGYTWASVSITDSTGSGATAEAIIRDVTYAIPGDGAPQMITVVGAIVGIRVLTAGSGYSDTPTVIITGDGGGAYAYAVVSPAGVDGPASVQLDIADPTGQGASIVPIISGGVITGVSVVNGGQGYTDPEVVMVNDAGGSGAVFGTPLVITPRPAAVSYYEQRRCFAGGSAYPLNIWMTKSGTESLMSYSLPIRDDDRISVRVAAREGGTIRHIVPLSQLIILTSEAEWRVTSVNNDAITPASISVKPQSYIGASNVQPVIVNNSLVYCAARGGHVRELGYNWQANGFISGDLSLRAIHLFDAHEILDMAFAKAPQPIIWFVSDSGKLLGLTYVPEQQVGAWHQHDTDGVFESCAVIPEGSEDYLYVIVKRTIGGVVKRYVERMESRQDAFFVDSGLIYNGAPSDEISGLDHLEGKTVSILADGAVHAQRVVTDGKITLSAEASVVHAGLPIQADLETLPVAFQVDGYGQGRQKNVNKIWVRVDSSFGLRVGPDSSHLTTIVSPATSQTQELQLMLTPSWQESGKVFIRQSDPLPLSVLSYTLEIAIGG
jgi:hypothetical protein